MHDFITIPLDEARTRLDLDGHFHDRTTLEQFITADQRIARMESVPEQIERLERDNPTWRETVRQRTPSQYVVRYYGNHTVLGGDLDMDLMPGEDIAGIVVEGDLELYGSILNWEIDTNAAFLWVKGNLHCRNIVFGCMDLVVQQNVTASGLIVTTYNHGHLLITGDVRADRVIIDDDGAATIDGKIHAKGWSSSLNADVELRASAWIDEIRPEFHDEFFRSDDDFKCGNGNVDLIKALLGGRNILKDD